MTHIEIMKQALEALEQINKAFLFSDGLKAITSLRQAIAKAEKCKYGQEPKSCTSSPMDCQCALDACFAETEKQEPVALKVVKGEICYKSNEDDQSFGMWCPVTPQSDLHFAEGTRFYTSPPQRQPLEEYEIERCVNTADFAQDHIQSTRWVVEFARAIEAAHGIKE